ncbi:MAG: orotate phosphoribosyltransferase [Candidatus Dormibacteraeota bacterium]|nr:orotate phosphoribosyltransferase [Candidatus Dormibacteraeota bacterium]
MTTELDAARTELHALLAERAFTFGDFVLTSGRRSDFYFNGKQVTLEGRGLYLASLLILERCRELRVDAIGGLTLGADPIAAGVAALSGQRDPLRAFIVRKEAKEHGTGSLIEGPSLRDGDRVMVVDDVITTGGSLLQACDALRDQPVEIVEALAVVDREEGGRANIEARGLHVHSLFVRSEFSTPAHA